MGGGGGVGRLISLLIHIRGRKEVFLFNDALKPFSYAYMASDTR